MWSKRNNQGDKKQIEGEIAPGGLKVPQNLEESKSIETLQGTQCDCSKCYNEIKKLSELVNKLITEVSGLKSTIRADG